MFVKELKIPIISCLTFERFYNLRQELFNKIISICQPSLNILLFGSEQLTDFENRQIFIAVQEFLLKSKRFDVA